MQVHILTLEAVTKLPHNSAQFVVEGIGKSHVTNHTLLEEGEGTDALGTVNDLVRHDKVTRLDLLLQTADSGESDDGADTERA